MSRHEGDQGETTRVTNCSFFFLKQSVHSLMLCPRVVYFPVTNEAVGPRPVRLKQSSQSPGPLSTRLLWAQHPCFLRLARPPLTMRTNFWFYLSFWYESVVQTPTQMHIQAARALHFYVSLYCANLWSLYFISRQHALKKPTTHEHTAHALLPGSLWGIWSAEDYCSPTHVYVTPSSSRSIPCFVQ